MTTAGLLVSQHGEPHYHMYAFTAAFMLLGIPTSSVFFAEVASELFDYHEKAVVIRRMSLIYGATSVIAVACGAGGQVLTGWLLEATGRDFGPMFVLTAMLQLGAMAVWLTCWESERAFE